MNMGQQKKSTILEIGIWKRKPQGKKSLMEGCSQVPNKNLQQKFRMIHLGLIPGAGNLGKLFIWMKIHGLM